VGGVAGPKRIWTRFPAADCRCARRRDESQSNRHRRLRSADQVPLTSNLKWADAPGNVALSARTTGLPKESVANVSQILTLDKSLLDDYVGKIPRAKLDLILSGIDVVLGR
jgi:mRNA-degrading endonuclease toxin of MazEF toxin-antitoxin module